MKTKKPGFTLLEMVVSISVIMMVTVLFIANFHSANKRTDLVMTAQNLAADLHAAQNNTLGLVKYNDEVPAGGWGISLDRVNSSSTYVMFADLNAPAGENGNPPAESGYMEYDPGTEGNPAYGARVVRLPAGISIIALNRPSAMGSINEQKVNVTFLPPDPQTNIHRLSGSTTATSTSLDIVLKDSNTGTTKTVKVNFLGLIEVKD